VIRGQQLFPTQQLVPTRRPDGGVRLLTHLGTGEAAHYDAAVAGLTPIIERNLGPQVLANRAVGRGAERTTRLEPWRPARAGWVRTLARALAAPPPQVLLVADVRRCYASIRPSVLATRLRALGAAPAEVARLRDLLERFSQDVPGLPIGPEPSAILANAVLGVVDERLQASGTRHVRWVDDIVAFTAGRREAVAAFDALRRGLDEVGLEPNPSKTEIVLDPERAIRRLLTGRPSASGASAVG
jgi:Reverse transcriptase (RNA-dependent DNA polymerase)